MPNLSRWITTGPEPTASQRRAASRVVLRNARNRDDLRLLLDALGLTTSNDTKKGGHPS